MTGGVKRMVVGKKPEAWGLGGGGGRAGKGGVAVWAGIVGGGRWGVKRLGAGDWWEKLGVGRLG